MNNKPSFLDAVTSITIQSKVYVDSKWNYYEYLLDHKADVWVLGSGSKIRISISRESAVDVVLDDNRYYYYGRSVYYGVEIDIRSEYIDAELINCVLSSATLSSPLKIFFLGQFLDRAISYEFDGVDHGTHVLQPKYSQFYSIYGYFADKEFLGEYFDFNAVKEISYPQNAPYDVDVVTNGKLVDNMNGVSLIEGVDALGGGVYIRIRYKNVNDPYFGPLDIKFIYEQGVLLPLPMEVVKNVKKIAL